MKSSSTSWLFLVLLVTASLTAVLMIALSAAMIIRRVQPSVELRGMKEKQGLSKQLVIARYMEDLSFLLTDERFAPYLSTAVIYNKGDDNISVEIKERVRAVISMPNVGRCDHTYLHHIVQGLRAKTLADRTVFITGSCMSISHKRIWLQNTLEGFSPPVQNIYGAFQDFQLEYWKATDGSNASRNPESKLLPADVRPFGKWLENVFGKDLAYNMVAPVFYGGIFFADANKLSKTPVAVYENLRQQLETHSNPEAGHYVERLWGFLACSANSQSPSPSPTPRPSEIPSPAAAPRIADA